MLFDQPFCLDEIEWFVIRSTQHFRRHAIEPCSEFFIATFSRVTSKASRLCKAISATIERPKIR
jgi:hypothetical protein